MPKRKFDPDDSEEQLDDSRAANNDGDSNNKRAKVLQAQLDAALSYGRESLGEGLKHASRPERQKLGRRQKEARAKKDDKALARLEAEVVALKELDYKKLAELYLYRTVCKIKSIADAAASAGVLPPYVRERVDAAAAEGKSRLDGDPVAAAAYANVTSRLFTAAPAKAALEECLAGVRRVLGLGAGQTVAAKAAEQQQRKEDGKVRNSSAEESLRGGRTTNEHVAREEEVDEEEEGIIRSGSSRRAVEKDSSGSEGFSDYEDLLGNESDASDSDDDDGGSGDRRAVRRSSFSPIRDGSDDDDDSDDDSDDEGSSPTDPLRSRHRPDPASLSTRPLPRTQTSTSLPALMGGYISGSESSDDEEAGWRKGEGGGGGELGVRKNRRGQQARRAIWERKYGAKARHLVNEGKEKGKGGGGGEGKNRDQGWDLRKGAQGGKRRDGRPQALPGGGGPPNRKERRKRQLGGANGFGGKQRGSGPNEIPVQPRGKTNKAQEASGGGGKLHPSWEAARLRKEMGRKSAASFAGSKIKFD